MQLRTARLCLDCNEVHDAQRCPICASETFAYLTRWVPEPEQRTTARPASSPEAEVYRELLHPETSSRDGRRRLKQGLVGLTALGLAGWLLKSRSGNGERLSVTEPPPSGDTGGGES